jgi:hypothetical protein
MKLSVFLVFRILVVSCVMAAAEGSEEASHGESEEACDHALDLDFDLEHFDGLWIRKENLEIRMGADSHFSRGIRPEAR